jgi:hypothetical protein
VERSTSDSVRAVDLRIEQNESIRTLFPSVFSQSVRFNNNSWSQLPLKPNSHSDRESQVGLSCVVNREAVAKPTFMGPNGNRLFL